MASHTLKPARVPQRPIPAKRPADAGVSLIEVLVAVLLIGLVITASLTSLRTTTVASRIDRDHANSFAWLQAASDAVYRGDRSPCTDGQSAAITKYNTYAQSAPRPPLWVGDSAATIQVVDVEFLGRSNPDAVFEWSSSFCFEGAGYADSPLYTQRVSIRVTTPDGLVKTLQMVKNAA